MKLRNWLRDITDHLIFPLRFRFSRGSGNQRSGWSGHAWRTTAPSQHQNRRLLNRLIMARSDRNSGLAKYASSATTTSNLNRPGFPGGS